jgi:preprotein translocase subunit SecE
VLYRHFRKHTYPNITKTMTATGIVIAMMIIRMVFELEDAET